MVVCGVNWVVRFGIVLFLSLGLLLVGAIVFVGDGGNPDEDLRRLVSAFEAQPEEARLREFLNAPADASYGLHQLALAGRLLVDHERVFRELAKKSLSRDELRILQTIAMLGPAIYEHFPELEPPAFEAKVADMEWLMQL